MPEFRDVIGQQRACRSFLDEPVGDEVLERILWAATRAPSAENGQPWVFVVVRNAEARRAIGELMTRAWEGGGHAHSVGRLPERLLADVDQGARGGLAEAAVMVVVCADAERAHPAAVPASVFPAVQNLLLAATAEGLGSVLTTLALRHADELRTLLDLPETVTPVAVIPLGRPARPLGLSRRRPLAEVAYRERFGQPW